MRFVIRRLGFFLLTLWAAVTINFVVPRLMPGNPALAMMAQYHGRVSGQALKALEVAFGVDSHQNVFISYFQYLGNCLTFNFGESFTNGFQPVSQAVMNALPWTMGLIGVTTVLAFVLGTVIGIVGAWRRGGILDSLLPPIFIITSAFPFFWFGMLCILVFNVDLHWLPGHDTFNQRAIPSWHLAYIGDVLRHAILPSLAILITSIGGWILGMRNNMITVLAEDYVRMARAKGLRPWKIMWSYAGRNALLPNLAGFAMSLGFVVSGAILVEYLFNYNGLGWLLLNAVESEDYALMQALFLLITVAVLVAVLLCDFLTAWIDPRTREVG